MSHYESRATAKPLDNHTVADARARHIQYRLIIFTLQKPFIKITQIETRVRHGLGF